MTAECLEILSSELKPLKEAEANGGLLPQVLSAFYTQLFHPHLRFIHSDCLRSDACRSCPCQERVLCPDAINCMLPFQWDLCMAGQERVPTRRVCTTAAYGGCLTLLKFC